MTAQRILSHTIELTQKRIKNAKLGSSVHTLVSSSVIVTCDRKFVLSRSYVNEVASGICH